MLFRSDVVYVALNMYWESLDFELPGPPMAEGKWYIRANTALPSPDDICEESREKVLTDQTKICVGGRSIIILVAR